VFGSFLHIGAWCGQGTLKKFGNFYYVDNTGLERRNEKLNTEGVQT